jgi:hypothetical protein
LDILTMALCISIGTGVPWLMAIHSDNSARQLIWNTLFGMVGVTLCALAFNWLAPIYAIIALISAGPIFALVAIVAGQALKRAVAARLAKPPS